MDSADPIPLRILIIYPVSIKSLQSAFSDSHGKEKKGCVWGGGVDKVPCA